MIVPGSHNRIRVKLTASDESRPTQAEIAAGSGQMTVFDSAGSQVANAVSLAFSPMPGQTSGAEKFFEAIIPPNADITGGSAYYALGTWTCTDSSGTVVKLRWPEEGTLPAQYQETL